MTAPANNDRTSETPEPPEGYETWLDYACATMDTRSAYMESCWKDGPPVPREEMRKAVDTELSALRAYRASEKKLSEAYLRIREIVGAWNTKPGGTDRFEVTEQKVREAAAKAAAYDEAMAALRLLRPNCVIGRHNTAAGRDQSPVCELCNFWKNEIASGRFKP